MVSEHGARAAQSASPSARHPPLGEPSIGRSLLDPSNIESHGKPEQHRTLNRWPPRDPANQARERPRKLWSTRQGACWRFPAATHGRLSARAAVAAFPREA